MLTFKQRASLAWRVLRYGKNSNLLDHAEKELALAFPTKDADFYGGMTSTALLELMLVFASQGHSGMSAGIVASNFERLADFKPLTPLTGADDEWNECSERDGVPWFQNRRHPSVFKDGEDGQAYESEAYVFEEPEQDFEGEPYTPRFTGMGSARYISFPYWPKEPTRVKVDTEGNRLDGRPRLPIMPEIENEVPVAADEREHELVEAMNGAVIDTTIIGEDGSPTNHHGLTVHFHDAQRTDALFNLLTAAKIAGERA